MAQAAYRDLATRIEQPLHLGITEAGTFLPGSIKSSAAGLLKGRRMISAKRPN